MVALPDRHRVRAILLDGEDVILFARTRPGVQKYWATPGGGVEPEDDSLLTALYRELDEELCARVTPPVPLTFLDVAHADGRWQRHHLYACRLESMDFDNRYGAEFRNPDRGTYELLRVPFTVDALAALKLQPAGLAEYLRDNIDTVWRAAQSGQAGYGIYFETGISGEELRRALHEAYGIGPAEVFLGTAEDLISAADPAPMVWINPAATEGEFGCELSSGDRLARRTGASELELATRLCRLTGGRAQVPGNSSGADPWFQVERDGGYGVITIGAG